MARAEGRRKPWSWRCRRRISCFCAGARESGRFRPGDPEGDPENGGRIIIDCLLNLPLLYWAHLQTGDEKYYDIAYRHALLSRRFLVRGDGSSYHTFYFNQENGNAIRGGTHQGYQDGSTWTRGQAWGIYGFALSYRYTRDERFWIRPSAWPAILSNICRRTTWRIGISTRRSNRERRATAPLRPSWPAVCWSCLS
ncbi:glycoside hydrolase family 88 protein [Paenibacillus sp. JTLBN-2024]